MASDRAVLVVLTTFDDEQVAVSVVRELVGRRLIACGNLLPGARSIYRWQGAVEDAREIVCLLKTTADRLDSLTAALTELHPYDVPEIVALPVTGGSAPYLAWVEEAVTD